MVGFIDRKPGCEGVLRVFKTGAHLASKTDTKTLFFLHANAVVETESCSLEIEDSCVDVQVLLFRPVRVVIVLRIFSRATTGMGSCETRRVCSSIFNNGSGTGSGVYLDGNKFCSLALIDLVRQFARRRL